jgi:hypothetical protein
MTKLDKLKHFEGITIEALAPSFPTGRQKRVGKLSFASKRYTFTWAEGDEQRESHGDNINMHIVDDATIELKAGQGFRQEGFILVTYRKVVV